MRPVIASAIIWASVIFAAAIVTGEQFSRLISILGGGAAAHVIILGAIRKNG